MNSWSIAQRLMNYDKGSFVRFILKLAYISTALSLAVMITATAVISGFNKEISDKIFGFWGHIQISSIHSSQLNLSAPIELDSVFTRQLDTISGIRHFQVFAYLPAIVTAGEEMEGLILKGVSNDFDWSFFKQFLVEGHIPGAQDTGKRQLVISKNLASRLKLKLNDPCRLHFVIEEYDNKLAIGDLSEIRALAHWTDQQIGGYELFVNDLSQIEIVSERIYDQYLGNELYLETIRQKFPSIFDWLNLQSTNQYVIQALMLLVAMINLITVLLILILERTRMIGTFKAIGMRTSALKRIFLFHGFQILSKGLLLGNVVGLLICLVQKYGKVIKLNEADYYLKIAPIHLNAWVLILINLGTILITLAVLWIPSGLVSRISPLKAIGYR